MTTTLEMNQWKNEIMTNWVKSLSQEEYEIVQGWDPDDLVDLWTKYFEVPT